MSNKMKVIVCRVGEEPTIETVDPGLESMQALVGGYVGCTHLDGPTYDRGIDVWYHDEYLLNGSAPNRLLQQIPRYKTDFPIHGDFFIAAHAMADDGEIDTVGLTDAEATKWLALAEDWPAALLLN